jgi:uncharacterized protein
MKLFGNKAPVVALILSALFSAHALAQDALVTSSVRYQDEKRKTNDMSVSIIVSALTCTCARFAEDIRNVVNDMRPGGLRVLPILSVGGVQNVKDILFLRGIDMGIVQQDNLYVLKNSDPGLYANIENRVQYITKLYNAEVHILARKEFSSLADLEGKTVNFHLKDSPAETTAENIFSTLKINVKKTYYDHDLAIEKLASGEIAATMVMTGAPQTTVLAVKKDAGLHFLPIDEESLPGRNVKPLLAEYLPAELTSELYPNLVEPGKPVSTIANRALLVAYNWPENTERYARVTKFVNEFFSKFDQFHDRARHRKWGEVNLAADVPGWVRFKPAKDWLDGKKNAITAQADTTAAFGESKTAFETFLENYSSASGRPITAKDREALISEFRQYIDKRVPKSAAR